MRGCADVSRLLGEPVNRLRIVVAVVVMSGIGWLTACTPSQVVATPAATVTVTATVTATPAPAGQDHVTGFPQLLQGSWCTKPDSPEQYCFDLPAIVFEYPGAFLADVTSNYDVGTISFTICADEEPVGTAGCGVANSMYLTYYPAGVSWHCEPPEGFGACNPDYTDAHDDSVERLVREHNHQHGDDYADSPPMYRG